MSKCTKSLIDIYICGYTKSSVDMEGFSILPSIFALLSACSRFFHTYASILPIKLYTKSLIDIKIYKFIQ